MRTALKLSICSALFVMLSGPTVHAQTSQGELSPQVRQRVEALLRSKAEFPPATSLSFKVVGLPSGNLKEPIPASCQSTDITLSAAPVYAVSRSPLPRP